MDYLKRWLSILLVLGFVFMGSLSQADSGFSWGSDIISLGTDVGSADSKEDMPY